MTSRADDRFAALVRDRLRARGSRETPGRRLVAVLRELAQSGALAPGTRLPSERELASAVGISRGTVAAAYRTLVADGSCERRHGSGTYLVEPPDAERADGASGVVGRLMRHDALLIDLSKSTAPDVAHLQLPELDPADLLRAPSQHGYDAMGDPGLRAALRERAPGEVLVTNGAQQGLELAARCLVGPGDVVLVDDPAYPGALAVIRRRGAEVVPVAGDEAGPDPEALAAAIARHRPAAAFLMAVHNPSGRVGAPDRVAAIAELARARGLVVVEDRTIAELVYDGAAPPPSYAEENPAGTVVVGSLSKTLWGGLRVGWVSAPAPLLARIVELKMECDLATNAVSQRMALALLGAADLDGWRAELARRRDWLAAALRRELPDWSWSHPRGGLSLWPRLPDTDTDAYAELARSHGVAVAPGSMFAPDGRHRDRLRLSFALAPELLDRAVAGLAEAWAESRSGAGGVVDGGRLPI